MTDDRYSYWSFLYSRQRYKRSSRTDVSRKSIHRIIRIRISSYQLNYQLSHYPQRSISAENETIASSKKTKNYIIQQYITVIATQPASRLSSCQNRPQLSHDCKQWNVEYFAVSDSAYPCAESQSRGEILGKIDCCTVESPWSLAASDFYSRWQ